MRFKRVLIANRGEIAVRLIRACRELGVSPVAIYSEVDRDALHVRLADSALFVGPAAARESYLAGDKIIGMARAHGIDAIHPGYGFLSENAQFALAVANAGLTFIGPSAESIEALGDKTVARATAMQAGVPVVPGVTHSLDDEAAALAAADEIGYPVMLKAAAGGGGKGMRTIEGPQAMASAFRLARDEAKAAFGDGSVYLEKLIQRPRHIEIQIVGDKHGNLIHLGERECSIQRRHQKVIEECPSPLNDADLRGRMGTAAIAIARASGYYSLGTVEFLVDANRNFYFLEMNTRLQVEHPVTEMVTGIDLVREQIRIAAGEPLACRQEDVRFAGAAIECRIYAEDAERNFLPSPGRITRLRTPAGPGVRDDSGVYEGWQIPLEYDPMISKLVAWDSSRENAIKRMQRALEEYEVAGIRTTIPFFKALLNDVEFQSGSLDTGIIARFMERHRSDYRPDSRDDSEVTPEQAAAAIVAAISRQTKVVLPVAKSNSRWRNG
jgi:acetyl-CoA carboxylase biotin carboxylase subunit